LLLRLVAIWRRKTPTTSDWLPDTDFNIRGQRLAGCAGIDEIVAAWVKQGGLV